MRNLFDKILTICRKWDTDKWVHIVAFLLTAWIIATVARIFLQTIGCPLYGERAVTGLAGLAVGIPLAVWKELFDKKTSNLFDREDLAASFTGLAIFYVVYCV